MTCTHRRLTQRCYVCNPAEPIPGLPAIPPPKLALLVAPPADERDAVRLIVDAIATEIIDPAALYAGLRPVLARLARGAVPAFSDPLIADYHEALLGAARTLERADARSRWARCRSMRRRWQSIDGRQCVAQIMLGCFRQFHGVDR